MVGIEDVTIKGSDQKAVIIPALKYLPEIYVLTYGEHRKGCKEYDRFENIFKKLPSNGISYVKSITVPGYKMYSSGKNPICIYTGNSYDIIECDILKLSQVAFNIMDHYEGHQLGHQRYVIPVKTKINNNAILMRSMIIYAADEDFTEEDLAAYCQEYIPVGDWIKHKNKKK